MGEREGNRRYDYETKLAAVRDHVEHGLTKAEVMEKYGIAGPAPLERWCRETGPAARTRCVRKPKGRPRGAKSKPRPAPTREQLLEEENAYLKARVAYLEKVDALLARRSATGTERCRLHAGGAGTSAPAPAQGGRAGEKHVLPSSVASGRRDPAGHRADGTPRYSRARPTGAATADTHVPRARVRGAGEPRRAC